MEKGLLGAERVKPMASWEHSARLMQYLWHEIGIMIYFPKEVKSMTILTISEKGQVTVPARVRRALGFKPGGNVEVEIVEDALLMRPARSIRSVRGFFAGVEARKAGDDWEQVRRETERVVAAEVAGEGCR